MTSISAHTNASSPSIALAPAKISLYLHTLGRRADGDHEIDSLVVFADAGDGLTMHPAAHLSLVVEGPSAASLQSTPPADNIILHAATALGEAVGHEPAFAFTLTKVLPMASGIDGGSADAAAALRLLASAWGIPTDDARVVAVAQSLGADVPVCLFDRSAYFQGDGVSNAPAPPLPSCPLVIVNPGMSLSRHQVFKARSGAFSSADRLSRPWPTTPQDLALVLASRTNDLTLAAVSLAPVVRDVLTALEATPDCLLARMSRSGPTCFALYPKPAAAGIAGLRIRRQNPDWWVHVGQTMASGEAV